MHKSILRIALPGIVSNITVPLLGLADTAISGHLGDTSAIGAVAVGGLLFNMAYWLFGFLRMGTGGLTAQACGAHDAAEARRVLTRALSVAAALALALIVLQRAVVDVAFLFVEATPAVEAQARSYFAILVWGAPAVLGGYAMTGWFVGMQDARSPMYVAVLQNATNVVASLFFVFGIGMKVEGVAAGTLLAQYVGMAAACLLWRRRYRGGGRLPSPRTCLDGGALRRFFGVNRDIFLRTLCLVVVTASFTAAGAAQGDTTLAANALLMQFFLFFSYVMDGFAYAGEAIGGRCCGAADRSGFVRTARCLMLWGFGAALLFMSAYACGGRLLLSLLTDRAEVIAAAGAYLPYVVVVPLVSFPAFLLDGLCIGATATRTMLAATAVGGAAFLLLHHTFAPSGGNHALWAAFLLYLALRGIVEGVWLSRRCVR